MSQSYLRDRELFIEHETLTGAEISGKGATSLLVVESTFQNCTFNNLSVKYACFGAGIAMSVYSDCVFEHSRITAVTPGRARFVRCVFRNVRLNKWIGNAVEMVDCTFTGQLREVSFNANVQSAHRSELGRDSNEYRNNDFSGAEFSWVSFRGGVDLSIQKLPTTGDHSIVDESQLVAIMARVDRWVDQAERERVQSYLEVLMENIAGGQARVLISPRNLEGSGAVGNAAERLQEEVIDVAGPIP